MHVNLAIGIWFFTWWSKMRAWSTDRVGRGHESGWLAFPQTDGRRETYPSSEQLLYLSLSCWVGCNWLLLSVSRSVFLYQARTVVVRAAWFRAPRDSHLVVNKTHTFPTPHLTLTHSRKMPLWVFLSLCVHPFMTFLSLVTQRPRFSPLRAPLRFFFFWFSD